VATFTGNGSDAAAAPVSSLPNGIIVLLTEPLWVDWYSVCLKRKRMEPENKRESFAELINGNTPVLVDFFAEWCGPCKMMKPVLEELRQKMGDKVRIIKIDIDKSPAAANTFQVQSVPTLMLFQKGKPLWRQSGVLQASQLENIIKQKSILQ
jgi:thioredoxin